MTPMKERLKSWCRYAHVDDTTDNGICRFTLKFKIRDTDTDEVFKSLSYVDMCDIAYTILNAVCPGCEDFDKDWMDPDNEAFVMGVRLEDGFIVMGGNYRA